MGRLRGDHSKRKGLLLRKHIPLDDIVSEKGPGMVLLCWTTWDGKIP